MDQLNDCGGRKTDMDSLCLICCSTSISSGNGYQNDNLLFNQEQVIFILKYLLQLPTSQLEDYLQAYGSPDQWLNLCDNCSQLTGKARELHSKLLKIEKELKDIQRKILDTIKSDSTTEQDNLDHQHHNINSKLIIWRETRSFVKNESYQNLYLYVKEEPIFLEPERSSISTPSPPPISPPDDHNSSVSYQVKEEFDYPDPDDISNSEDNYLPSPSSSSSPTPSTSSPPTSPTPKKANLLTCDICGKTAFSSQTSLSVHRARFHKVWKIGPHKERKKVAKSASKKEKPFPPHSQVFPCPSCSLTFRFGTKWESHLQTVHNSEELPCFMENCDRKFYRLRDLLSHLTVHRTGKEFVCPHCPGKVYPDRGSLNYHLKIKHNPEGPPPKPDISRLTCEICGCSKFCSISSLATHRIKVHKVWKRGPKRKFGKKKDQGVEGPPEKHLCDLCGSIFKNKTSLQTHVKMSHEKWYPCHCHLCGRGTTSARELKFHMVRWHKEEAEKEGLEMYTCQVEGCTKYYIEKEKYDKHLREDHGDDGEKDKPFKCEECGKGFFWKGRLALHQMTHKNKGLKCFQCEFCDKGYPMLAYLKRHLRVVHGVKSKKGE